jgi:ABC-type multidrug transport system fused ATPase/permease subunit
LRLAYLQALFKQPIQVFDRLPSGKPTNTITSSSNTIQIGVSGKLSLLIQSIALIIGAYAVAFRFSWALTLASSSAILFIFLVFGITVPNLMKLQRKVDLADQGASSLAGEVFGTIRTVIACGAEGRLAERYAKWVAESRARALKMSPVGGAQVATSFFAIYCNFALTFWLGLKLYRAGSIKDVGGVIT